MTRHLAAVARWGLLVVGVALLLWWPVSYYFFVQAKSPRPFSSTGIGLYQGFALIFVEINHRRPPKPLLLITRDQRISLDDSLARPHWGRLYLNIPGYFYGYLWLPLWQLALLALAWPVASFYVRRRRRKGRGFEVVDADAGEAG